MPTKKLIRGSETDVETAATTSITSHAPAHELRMIKRLLLALLFFVVLGALSIAKEVIVPLFVALLFALLLSPVVTFLERMLRLPRFVGSLLTTLALVAALLYGIVSLAAPAREWIAHAPATLQTIEQHFSDFRAPIRQVQDASRKLNELTQPASSAPPAAPAQPNLLSNIASATPHALGEIGAVLLLVYFFLSSGDGFLRRTVEIAPTLREKKVVVAIARGVQDEMSRYLATLSMINFGLGVVTAIIALVMGLPNPLLWGAVACIFNFAPFIGPACTGLALALAGLSTFDSLAHALAVPAAFFTATTIEGQLITPAVIGRRFSLNPAIVFIWLMFWGWMWGLVGLLLAGPLLACVRIICEHVESLRAIATLISGDVAIDKSIASSD